MNNRIQKTVKKIPKHIWILLFIVMLGVFIRGYKLSQWLDFGDDQVHDAILVESVVKGESPWPLLGPDMSKSGGATTQGTGRDQRFHIGPIYYYFQIISAKIFGWAPDRMAYPDFLFSILSIPLLYYFLTLLFDINLSLTLTGIYAISFYSIKFSHSAWNPNIIPFFALLFFVSLWTFLVKRKKISYYWAISLGTALGVGIQLHAIVLILFPAVTFFVFLYLLKNKQIAWGKWILILIMIAVFNFGQILSEINTGFNNSKAFYASLANGDASSAKNLMVNLVQDTECHIQANLHIATSLGDKKDCSFYITNFINGSNVKKQIKKVEDPIVILGMILATAFSVFGYGLIIDRLRKEKELEKKYFLGLLILYASLSFFVLFPVISSALRYFVHTIFIPFVFLGLMVEWFLKKYSLNNYWVAKLFLVIIVILNIFAIYPVWKEFSTKTRNTPREKIVLGESNEIAEFIIANSAGQSEAYLETTARTTNFMRPVKYLASEMGFNLITNKNEEDIPSGKNIFYIALPKADTSINEDEKAEILQNFGKVDVYKKIK